MRLLIITQTVDVNDPILGFFHRWIEELAKHCERVEVICLREGEHRLPKNVRVHSLGKESGERSRIAYAVSFSRLIWSLRNEYDAVFVHMNQEYVFVGGWLWKLLGKRIYLWRNHYAGSFLTDVAALFCSNVFCTSKYSYTARYAKTIIMPVGVDTERFKPDARVARKPRSILFLARMSPSKRPEMLIDALATLARDHVDFTASLVGSPLLQDEPYYWGLTEKVRALGLTKQVSFFPSVPNSQAPDLYRAHEIFVNTSPSGMLDKTIFEAAACGCRVLAASEDFAGYAGPGSYFDSVTSLARRLREALSVSGPNTLEILAKQNSLSVLGAKLVQAL